jgi:sec-independent protein translocase protein TatB
LIDRRRKRRTERRAMNGAHDLARLSDARATRDGERAHERLWRQRLERERAARVERLGAECRVHARDVAEFAGARTFGRACYVPSVFGFSFPELVVLIIVAMVVIGPKELPKILRKLGQWSGKIRRFALDMRVQSGIDDALRTEGLDQDIAEIRKLARGELDGVVAATRSITRFDEPANAPTPLSADTASATPAPNAPPPTHVPAQDNPTAVVVERDREFPREGADAYGALPDTAIVYAEGFPASPLANDPLYARGDAA